MEQRCEIKAYNNTEKYSSWMWDSSPFPSPVYQYANRVNIGLLKITYLALELSWSEIFLLLQQLNKVLIHRPLNWGWNTGSIRGGSWKTQSDPWSQPRDPIQWACMLLPTVLKHTCSLSKIIRKREGEFKGLLTGVSQHYNELVMEQLAGLLVAHTLHYLLLLIRKKHLLFNS